MGTGMQGPIRSRVSVDEFTSVDVTLSQHRLASLAHATWRAGLIDRQGLSSWDALALDAIVRAVESILDEGKVKPQGLTGNDLTEIEALLEGPQARRGEGK